MQMSRLPLTSALSSLARAFQPRPTAVPRRRPNPRWAQGAARSKVRRLRVLAVVQETPSVKTFVVEAADGLDLHYRAGQHLTLLVDVGGRVERRCYSFSSAPAAGSGAAFTVKRVEGGVVSNYLHDRVEAGQILKAADSSGSFTLAPEPGVAKDAARTVAMVAGGVGITPLVSMIEELLLEEPHSGVHLLYGSRCEAEILFRRRLDGLASRFPSRLRVTYAVDQAGSDWPGVVGALDGASVVRLLGSDVADGYYLCGPEAMMDGALSALRAGGVDDTRIHLERFSYAASPATALPTAPSRVTFARSGTTTSARPGQTLLAAAQAAGVELPFSCTMGGCGACKVKVRGNVVQSEPNCLSPKEREEGFVLSCCAYGDGNVEVSDF